MLTYTSARNLLGFLTGDSSAANLTNLDTLHNEAIREVISMKPWGYRQGTATMTPETDNVHNLPGDCGKVVNITVTQGSTKYTPHRIESREEWDYLTQSTNVTSNIPEAYFVFGKTFSFYPAPSSATGTATVTYEKRHKDLSIADYTTGTITTATNGSTSITGSGTSWTSAMAGRYLRITEPSGDGVWYEIDSVTSTTVLVLKSPYMGTSISAGSATYTIGQTSMIPEEHQMAPIYKVLVNYFSYVQPEVQRAQLAKQDFAEAMRRMQTECGSTAI